MNEQVLPNELAQSADFEFFALEEAKNYRRALVRSFDGHLRGRVLEVGAGIGPLTALLLQLPAIRELVAIEPDARFCDRLKREFPKLRVVRGTVDDLQNEVNWDAILSVNVLEHIGDDEHELAAYHRLLAAENGVLCLFVPARPEIYAPIDKDFGHHRRYTRSVLEHKLQGAGFQILTMHYFNIFGYFAWWFNFHVRKQRRFDRRAVSLFDAIVFPPLHFFETTVCRPPIGQSLLTVARPDR
ncbi:MAG: hypothetical protein QOH39_2145 [Verrucomicrobiota bacterium]|jgi:SAM-dependent methyltransferase